MFPEIKLLLLKVNIYLTCIRLLSRPLFKKDGCFHAKHPSPADVKIAINRSNPKVCPFTLLAEKILSDLFKGAFKLSLGKYRRKTTVRKLILNNNLSL